MSKESGIRVHAEESVSNDETGYSSILNENLELLRKVETLSAEVVASTKKSEEALKAQFQAEKSLMEEQKKRKAGGYRKGRRIMMGLHVVLALVTMLIGPVLWFKHLAEPQVCFLALPGLLWLGIMTAIIYDLADQEARYN